MEDSRLALNDAHGFSRLLPNNVVKLCLADRCTRLFIGIARRLDLLGSMTAAEHENLALGLLRGNALRSGEVCGIEEVEDSDGDVEVTPEVTVEILIRLVDVGATGDGGLTGLSADDRADLGGNVGVARARGHEGDTGELPTVKLVDYQRFEAVYTV